MTDCFSDPLEIPGTLAEALREMVREGELPTSDAKRHHFIPKFLLRSFLEPRTQRLYQLDKTTGECMPVTPEAAASRRRLYRVTDDTGQDNDYLEGLLALVEDHAARSIRALIHDPYRLDEGDRANIAFLLALQDQRTPAGQGKARRQFGATARLFLETRLEDRREFLRLDRQFFGRKRTAEEVEGLRQRVLRQLSSRELEIEPSKELILRTMLEGWLDLAGRVHSLSWKVLRTEKHEFVIGDRPLTMTDPTPPYPWSGSGWTSSDHAWSTMPLAPDVCLRLDQSDEPIALRRAERQVERLNLRSYGWAERFVYGRRRRLLEELHTAATEEPERVERPRPNPQVILEEADPDDPAVGAEHPPDWPRGLWVEDDDGGQRWCSYYLVHE